MTNIVANVLFGHVQLVQTERWEGNKLILGGYCIHYDANGNEVSRTKDEPNIVATFPEPERGWFQRLMGWLGNG